jgi:disulfide bond formation protein DsbB
MTAEQVETFLTLGSLVVLAGLVVLALAAPLEWSGGVAPLSWIADRIYGVELWAAFALAGIATGGSLYFSESAGYIPCTLCWYQRIAMYPLVLLLGIAAVRRDRGMALYGLVLSVAGAAIALYHLQLTWFPEQASFCKQGALCEVEWFKIWGFATIPYLALVAFAGIAALCLLSLRTGRQLAAAEEEEEEEEDDEG